ncbi:hypothetical protein K501DRAFT_276965 [Backusella circina FSU 941]|nr:hypothetical protein K501DRAFT_276965 [Backusella circina FSU 941]
MHMISYLILKNEKIMINTIRSRDYQNFSDYFEAHSSCEREYFNGNEDVSTFGDDEIRESKVEIEVDVELKDLYMEKKIISFQNKAQSGCTKGFNYCRFNLYRKATITLREALFGFHTVTVDHMDGRHLKCKLYAKKGVIKPGTIKRIRGEGMPKSGGENSGNLFIEIKVVFPDSLVTPQPQEAHNTEDVLLLLKSCFPEPVVMAENSTVKACDLLDATLNEISIFFIDIDDSAESF